MKYLFCVFIFGLCTLASCSNDDEGDSRHADEITEIQQYLTDNGLTALNTESGLHYIITREGSGAHPTISDEVTVSYKGYLLDGSVFDATAPGETIAFPLDRLIEGWQEGIPLLKAGGAGIFICPSRLGYGERAQPGIPAHSILVFEIDLVSF